MQTHIPIRWLCLPLLAMGIVSCKTLPSEGSERPKPATIYRTQRPGFTQEGIASYYAGRWIGRKTANGERYRAHDMTAAHKTLPFNTMVRVTNLRNGKSVIVRINNRGPYIKGRIIDLSIAAAREIDMVSRGIVRVRIEKVDKIPVQTRPNLRTKAEKPEPKPTPRQNR